MISGRTFAREMIALRQRETKRAGRILALQGQNPGQLELRTHSEFGANLSVTPGGFAFLCLRAIPRRSSPAGYHSLRLRPAKTKPQYLLLHPAMPNPRDERLIYTPHHPVRWPYRRRPHLLKSSLHVRKQPIFDGLYDIMTEKADKRSTLRCGPCSGRMHFLRRTPA